MQIWLGGFCTQIATPFVHLLPLAVPRGICYAKIAELDALALLHVSIKHYTYAPCARRECKV